MSKVLSKFVVTFHFFFLCCAKEVWVFENIESDAGTLKIFAAMQKL